MTIIFSIKVVLTSYCLETLSVEFYILYIKFSFSQKAEWSKDFYMKNVWYCITNYMY
jgi:hypothetical protein